DPGSDPWSWPEGTEGTKRVLRRSWHVPGETVESERSRFSDMSTDAAGQDASVQAGERRLPDMIEPRPPTRDDVLAARETIAGRVHRTPTFSSSALGERVGARAFLKAELLQKTGSFKPRGVLTKLAALSADEKARGVVTLAGGDPAQAGAGAA